MKVPGRDAQRVCIAGGRCLGNVVIDSSKLGTRRDLGPLGLDPYSQETPWAVGKAQSEVDENPWKGKNG